MIDLASDIAQQLFDSIRWDHTATGDGTEVDVATWECPIDGCSWDLMLNVLASDANWRTAVLERQDAHVEEIHFHNGMSLAEQIVRALLTDDGGFVRLSQGSLVLDVTVDLSDEQVAYLRSLGFPEHP